MGGPVVSERQREVLQLIARGHTDRQIAHALGISIFTVQMHCRRLKSRLGASTRAEAVQKGQHLI